MKRFVDARLNLEHLEVFAVVGELLLSRLAARVRHDQRQHREAPSKPACSYLPEHSDMRSVSCDKSVKVTASAHSRGKITRRSLFPVLEKIYRKDFSILNCIAVNKLYGKELPHCVSVLVLPIYGDRRISCQAILHFY